MKVLLSIFGELDSTRQAVKTLLDEGTRASQIGLIARPHVLAQLYRDFQGPLWDRGRVRGGDLGSLETLLVGQRAVNEPQLGRLIVAGPLRRLFRRSTERLAPVIALLGVGEAAAEAMADGVRHGQLVLSVHRGGQLDAAARLCRQHGARHTWIGGFGTRSEAASPTA